MNNLHVKCFYLKYCFEIVNVLVEFSLICQNLIRLSGGESCLFIVG